MRGDRFAIPPPLHIAKILKCQVISTWLRAGMSLPLCENPETASEIVVVPARERLGKLDLPFILSVANVFNAEFDNDGYHHVPYRVMFIAHAKLFHLPLLRQGQQLMDQFVHQLGPGCKPKLEMETVPYPYHRVTKDGYISSFPADVRPGTRPEGISKDQND
ncbi:hypothetical protein EDD18DRAFT_1109106 [Armillaria luteobubalina]|uniref:Uncharacterized protein n=1 Tax=Armillaria luteobubalina TaxID=153913 RepID=A0AA39TJZ9_9AGAR|nr:hypothetical protein EDD18DRAFT_1109106 [Armillaria luteobubalina]